MNKFFVSCFLIIIIIGTIAFFSGVTVNNDEKVQRTLNGTFPEIKSSDRILIFAPHPDDDVLANSGIIMEALRKNADIKVVFMTVGDALDQDYLNWYLKTNNITNFKGNIGDIRHIEALTALSELGLNESNAIFLGYPDQGIKSLFLNNWDYNNLLKKTSGSNQNDHSPYNFSFEKNAPYCGANVVKNLNQIFDDFNPNIIFIPDDGDDHPDHWATNAFTRYIITERGYNGSHYHYLVHKGYWPNPELYSPEDQLLPPKEIFVLDATWLRLMLYNTDIKTKLEAIESHKTQTLATKDYLLSFVRIDEFFATYPVIKVQEKEIYSLDDGMPDSRFNDLKGEFIKNTEFNQKYDKRPTIEFNYMHDKRNINKTRIYDDIDSVGLVKDEQNLYAVINSPNFNENFNYIFYMYLYDGNSYRKLDINVTNNTANYLYRSSDSIVSSQKLEVKNKDQLTSVKIPLSIINNTQTILMTVDERNARNQNLDNTPLRVFQL